MTEFDGLKGLGLESVAKEGAEYTTLQTQISTIRARIPAEEERLENLQKQLAELQASMPSRILQNEGSLAELQGEIRGKSDEIGALTETLKLLRTTLPSLENSRNHLAGTLEIRILQFFGGHKNVLAAGDVEDFDHIVLRHDAFQDLVEQVFAGFGISPPCGDLWKIVSPVVHPRIDLREGRACRISPEDPAAKKTRLAEKGKDR